MPQSLFKQALYFETYIPEYVRLFDKLPISAFKEERNYGDVPLTELQICNCFYHDICITENKCFQLTNVSICHQVKNA